MKVQAAVLAAALLLVAQALLDKVSLAVAVKQAETAVAAVELLPRGLPLVTVCRGVLAALVLHQVSLARQ